MSIRVAPPSSFDINISTTHPKNTDPNAASSSATTTTTTNNNNNDDHGKTLALSKSIREDLISIKESMKEYMDAMNMQINQACDKFEEIQTRGSSETELYELRKAVTKLKSKIPSQLKIYSPDSILHRNPWPDVNKASAEMIGNLEKEFEPTINDPEGLRTALSNLPFGLKLCLLSFSRFPEMATIMRRVIIYWWMAEHSVMVFADDRGNEIFEELITKGFVEPVYQKCSLVPDSCRMSPFVRSILTTEAEIYGFTSFYTLGQDSRVLGQDGYSCLNNVSEAIIYGGPELFARMKNIKIAYLGRWHSLASHHIEVADAKFLYALKKKNGLRFLSLRGISLITELPSFITELTDLRILDLRACHNLEVIPEGIGLLQWLTHLDMSECYFLDHMPKGLANLSNLKVLKGFFIGDTEHRKGSCTLDDLSKLLWLRKLNIYTSVKEFPTERHFSALRRLASLEKLTISWGGCSLVGENETNPLERSLTIGDALLLFLHKLDLQGFPWTSPPSWLRPANLKGLKKLYIRGGKLCHLGKFQMLNDEDQRTAEILLGKFQMRNDEDQWTVEILRLRYLSDLVMDWRELGMLFPRLTYLQKVECPKLHNFPCDGRGEWLNIERKDRLGRTC